MRNHGTRSLRGLSPEATSGNVSGLGRFRRLFPASFFNPPNLDDILEEVGKPGGPMDGGATPISSTSIPLGFGFFGQLVDHDITLDATSKLDAINDPFATVNFRTPALDLDCVYGFGPEVTPYLYDNEGHKLLVARDGSAFPHQSVAFRAHDLCRSAKGTAMIGDPRNDENRVISQLQLAFIRFHNAVMEKVLSGDAYINSLRIGFLGDDDDFEFARRMVQWHYQWIINNEFLPMLCGSNLVNLILGTDGTVADRDRKIYDKDNTVDRAFIPIEFAVAAYRFGHSMISHNVKTKDDPFNEEPLFGLSLGRGFTPLSNSKGIMNWTNLFDVNGSNFQKSDQLDTKLASILLNLPFIDDGSPTSLAFRNLKRGFSFQLPSGEEVVDLINAELTDPANQITKLTAAEIAGLSANQFGTGPFVDNTPLWYYILAEAETKGPSGNGSDGGEGLGPTGGRIVAETLIGIQQKDDTSYLAFNANTSSNWTPNLIQGQSDFTIADMLTFS